MIEFIAQGNCDVYTVTAADNPHSGLTCVLKHITVATNTFGAERVKFISEEENKKRQRYDALLKLNHENVIKYMDYGKNAKDVRLGRLCWYSLQEFLSGTVARVFEYSSYYCYSGTVT